MTTLSLRDYFSLINLKDKYNPSTLYLYDYQEIIDDLLHILLQEDDDIKNVRISTNYLEKRHLLRGLLNRRDPRPLPREFLTKMDSLLQAELKNKKIVKVNQLNSVSDFVPHTPFSQSQKLILWQGDITLLETDAIVNAANNQMLGCFQPFHMCIDNAIHSAAGPQLREDCAIIMSAQDSLEETGKAKITRAYNLPSQFVLHTVGPIVPNGTELTEHQKKELASCYISCLELAHAIGNIKTIAFCAISTGVFGFPKTEAAKIAVNTVNNWLESHQNHFDKFLLLNITFIKVKI
jgi:O-acetyl-ADP-ribose deacetylase (regulator of RNase III)